MNIAGGAHQGAPSNHVNAVVKGSRIKSPKRILLGYYYLCISSKSRLLSTLQGVPNSVPRRPRGVCWTCPASLLERTATACLLIQSPRVSLAIHLPNAQISIPRTEGIFPYACQKKKPQPHASSLQRARRAKSKSPVNPRLIRTAAMFLRCCVISLSV